MLYYFKKGNNAAETQKKIYAVYGEGTVPDQTYEKQFVKLHAEDFSLNNAPWLGKPLEVDSDQIKTLTENNQYYTMWEIVNILKISKSIKLLVKMKNVSFIFRKKPCGLLANPICTTAFLPTYLLMDT